MRILIPFVIAAALIALGYAVGSRRNRVDDDTYSVAMTEHDNLQIACRIAYSAIRTALRDPNIEPQTSVTLDDARQELVRVLPKGHLP